MGSSEVDFLVEGDELHVASDSAGFWWAVGKEGSYGGNRNRRYVVAIACDASASGSQGKRRIVVHRANDRVHFIITKVKMPPSSQMFQDDVP